MKPIFTFFAFFVLLGANALAAEESTETQLDRIKSLLRREFCRNAGNVDAVKTCCRSLQADGSWPDIDYADQTRSGWKTFAHLGRVSQMAAHLVKENGPLHQDPELKRCTLLALQFWVDRDIRNPNWWWPIIGTPKTMGEILLLLEDVLERKTVERALPILKRTLDHPGYEHMTGANLIWVLKITLYYGLITGEPEHLRKASDRVAGEIGFVPPTREGGLLEDCSFIQHGPILYSHGYGASFLQDCAFISAMLAGTDFAIPREKLDILTRMTLDGNQWLERGGTSDYIAEGREITRPNQNARYLKSVAENLLRADAGRQEELRALILRFENPKANPLVGNRAFWCADTIVHQRPDFYFSVRMCSPRTVNSEICNGEGLKSWYLGCGTTPIMCDGNEYYNIFPLWDWSRLPGTTAPETPGPAAKKVAFRGKRECVGVVSDGMYGVAGFDFALDALEAKKSWFFFDEGVLCLGCGITDTSGAAVNTTLNQTFLRGEVKVRVQNVGGDSTILKPSQGEHRLENVHWISHDKTAYVFPEPRTAYLRNEKANGTWQSISATDSSPAARGDVFLLGIEHGVNPERGRYAYFVTPNQNEARLDKAFETIRIVRNDPQVQAVWNEAAKIGGVVFYKPGKVELAPEIVVERAAPGFVLVRQTGAAVTLHVATPGKPAEVLNPTERADVQPQGNPL